MIRRMFRYLETVSAVLKLLPGMAIANPGRVAQLLFFQRPTIFVS